MAVIVDWNFQGVKSKYSLSIVVLDLSKIILLGFCVAI